MIRALVLFILLQTSYSPSWAQATTIFQREYGSSECRAEAVKQTFDGGYVMAGVNSGATNIFLVKTNSLGQLIWSKSYGGSGDERLNRMIQTRDSGFVMVGSTTSYGSGLQDVYLIKTNASGDVEWSKTYGGAGDDIGSYVGQTADGGYMVAGSTESYGNGQDDCYLIRTAANGQMLWAKTYGGIDDEQAYSACLAKDGGVMMVGQTTTNAVNGGFDAYFARTDSNGNLRWAMSLDYGGIGGGEEAFDVVEAYDGGFVISMEPEHVGANTKGGEFSLLKLDDAGNFVWVNPVHGWDGWDFGFSMKQIADSGFVVAGARGLFTVQRTMAVLYKADKNGNVQWFKSFGDSINKREFFALDVTADGGVLAAGYVRDNLLGYTGSKFYLVKTDAAGNSGYCYESNEIPPVATPNLVFRPGGTAGSGGVETSPVTVATVIAMGDTALPCSFVNPSCPDADFAFSTACLGDTTFFTDLTFIPSGSNQITMRIWDYGDGRIDTLYAAANPGHLYTSAGSYIVRLLVYGIGSCADSAIKTIAVQVSAVAGNITSSDDSVCAGALAILTVSGSSGALQWQSSFTGTGFTDIADANVAGINQIPSQTTFYRVVAASGNCKDTSQVFQLVVNPLPPIPVVTAADTQLCSGDSTRICSSGTYASYIWNTSETGSCIEAKNAGGYWVTVSDVHECTVTSNRVDLSVYPVPSVSIVVNGDTLSSFGATFYQWYRNGDEIPGANQPIYIVDEPGYYSLKVTDINDCAATSAPVLISGIEETAEEDVRIYPNPSVDGSQITVHSSLVNAMMDVYDNNGRLVFQTAIRYPLTAIFLSVSPGVYFIRIYSERASVVRRWVRLPFR